MAGEGRPRAGYPPIGGQPALYLERQLDAYADGRRESMFMTPIAQRLSAGERRQTARHYAGQAKEPDRVGTGGRGQALATRGDHKLRVQACDGCHGPGGSGRAPSTPYLAGLERDYLARELRRWRSGERRSDPSGAMNVIARSLADADIDALADYYSRTGSARAR